MDTNKPKEVDKHNSKADKQLSSLNHTLKNMIRTNRKTDIPVQMGLSGFYEEISKTIKRK